jgi:hypothetical protein
MPLDPELKKACALLGSFEDVQRLVDNGVDVCGVDEWTHNTALHIAAQFGSVKIVKLLLQHDAKVDIPNANVDIPNALGNTPLLYCIRYMSTLHSTRLEDVNHLEVVNELIKAKADVNYRNRLLCSPLHEAALSGSRRVAKLLVQHGAKVFALDIHNRMPVDMVRVGNTHNPDNQKKVAIYLYDEMERVDRALREQLCRDDFLPFAMGLHPRLGNISSVSALSIDTLRETWNALRRAHNLPIEE